MIMARWLNSDGLDIPMGVTEADVGKAGEYSTVGPQRMIEVKIPDLTDLGTSAAIQDYSVWVPKGAFIEKVELVADTAATSGGAAVLNVGLIRSDQTTELDYDGFIAAAAITTFDADGDTVEYIQGSTGHGALIGTTLAFNGLVTADYDTAAFTAGAVTIRVFYSF
jgi:hypothetical protein